jgi:hypothetical protein
MKHIGVLEADEAPSNSPRYFEKKSIVHGWVRRAEAVWIKPGHLVQKLEARVRTAAVLIVQKICWTDGPIGRGNLIPFGTTDNQGDPLHYETPPAGYHYWHRRFERKGTRVSSRKFFNSQPIPAVPLTV